MGSGIVSHKALFRAVMFFGVVWLFYVGILADNATKMVTRATVPSAGILEHWTRFIGRERRPFHHDFDPNYVSKRRVPNGPDPIHNRSAVIMANIFSYDSLGERPSVDNLLIESELREESHDYDAKDNII